MQNEVGVDVNDYLIKEEEYFRHTRLDLIGLIPVDRNNRLLEIGAAGGDSLIEIKRKKLAQECVGLELFALEKSNQHHPLIDKMIFANIEHDKVDLPLDYFDVIICGDVLEHLVDPWKTLERITTWLKPGGVIIISTPNFRFIGVMKRIFFQGNFEYQTSGIMDKTHMRFFCKPNVIELANTGSLNLEKIYSSIQLQKLPQLNFFSKFTLGLFKDFFTPQYITVSRKLN